jgi:hypothetical protein
MERERATARQAEIERNEIRAIEHVCAPWKGSDGQFRDCGGAYRIYEQCEAAMSRALDRQGLTNSAGVSCEYPVYLFHAREQKEIEDAMRGSALDEAGRPRGGQ